MVSLSLLPPLEIPPPSPSPPVSQPRSPERERDPPFEGKKELVGVKCDSAAAAAAATTKNRNRSAPNERMRKEEAAGHGVSGKGLLAVHKHYLEGHCSICNYEALTYFDAKFCQFLFPMCRHMQTIFCFHCLWCPTFFTALSVGRSLLVIQKVVAVVVVLRRCLLLGLRFSLSVWKEDEETSLATADTFGIAPSSHTILLYAPHIRRDRCKEGTKTASK